MKNIAIRVDASSQIGTGHFMRCLTLADALKQRGAQTRFISRHLPDYLRNTLEEKGHDFRLLNGHNHAGSLDQLSHSHWLGTSQCADAQDSLQALSDRTWDWVIVDHYALDAQWETVLRQATKSILVIDDIADRLHDCDILLDQNFYSDMNTRYAGKVPAHCHLLLGPRYALLRDEFRQLREKIKPRTGIVQRILVFFGGVDADNYTGLVIDGLASLGVEGVHIDVVIGASHPYREFIESFCAEHQFNCYVQTSRMAELMAAADLAIGAGGSATWERCCVGLPAFAICTADNQFQQVIDAASEGLVYAPEIKGEVLPALKMHVNTLFDNRNLIRAMSSNAMRFVDGRGTSRVAVTMGCSDIIVRLATQDDSKKLFEWRNHPIIREVSRNSAPINWKDHQDWFDNTLSLNDRVLLIGERDDIPVGVVRFDMRGARAEVSIYLVPGTNELGLGRELLCSAEEWLSERQSEIFWIHAHVLGGNQRSQNLFLGAGYQLESANYLKRIDRNG